MTIEEIKDEYAKKQGYKNWRSLLFSFQYTRIMKIDELINHENATHQLIQYELKNKISDELQDKVPFLNLYNYINRKVISTENIS